MMDSHQRGGNADDTYVHTIATKNPWRRLHHSCPVVDGGRLARPDEASRQRGHEVMLSESDAISRSLGSGWLETSETLWPYGVPRIPPLSRGVVPSCATDDSTDPEKKKKQKKTKHVGHRVHMTFERLFFFFLFICT